jgi:hypothetical protein
LTSAVLHLLHERDEALSRAASARREALEQALTGVRALSEMATRLDTPGMHARCVRAIEALLTLLSKHQ